MKRNEIKEISLKVKNCMVTFVLVDNLKPHLKETIINEDAVLIQELNEIYEKLFDDKNRI